MSSSGRLIVLSILFAAWAAAVTPDEVLLVANGNSPVSRSIAEYYARSRSIAADHVLFLAAPVDEEIERGVFAAQVAAPIGDYLRARGWVERILVLVTTSGVPLKIRGRTGLEGDAASVDSELAALYPDLHGRPHSLKGPLANPYFGSAKPFAHPAFPLYLVTRLGGYTFADVRAMIDRSREARNRGMVVLDQRGGELDEGDLWLQRASNRLMKGRCLLDGTREVVLGARGVIGYASWGSNDRRHRQRDVGFEYLPGALVTEYVSTDGRTFAEPPPSWSLGEWKDRLTHFAGSPQSLSADFIRQGASGASGHVYEPYLGFTPRPDYLFPAYLSGRSLAESYWSAIPALSWMNIVVGDPLTRLAR